jgi:hypothetical protein
MISRPVGHRYLASGMKPLSSDCKRSMMLPRRKSTNAALGAFGDMMVAWFWPMPEAFSKTKGAVDERK